MSFSCGTPSSTVFLTTKLCQQYQDVVVPRVGNGTKQPFEVHYQFSFRTLNTSIVYQNNPVSIAREIPIWYI